MSNLVHIFYIKKLTLEELKKKNDYFLIIKNIDTLFLFFNNLLDKNKFEIYKNKSNDSYHLTIFFNTIIADEKLDIDIEREKFSLFVENKKIQKTLNLIHTTIDDNKRDFNSRIESLESSLENKINENKESIENELEKIKNFNKNIINQLKEETKSYFLNLCWPIGSYYWTNKNNNPEDLFGGEWEKIEGRFVYAADNKRKVDSTGGEERVTLSVDEIPSHQHAPSGGGSFIKYKNNYSCNREGGGDNKNFLEHGETFSNTSSTGGGQSHENMPPYIAAFCWKRVG